MSVLHLPGVKPEVILFDWHATLVDTMDAMYHAVDDVLPKLEDLNLLNRMVKQRDSKTDADARLVNYVRIHRRLHPKIKAEKKISRTDIFQVLFGEDEYARRIIHREFDKAYHRHIGEVYPFEDGILEMLEALRIYGIRLGVLSNRSREYLLKELELVATPSWAPLFESLTCGTDVERRKPAPDLILKALSDMDVKPGIHCWYVGDSTTDVIAANDAGVTSIFYNGAQWDDKWLETIFPGTMEHPHTPDLIINNFTELLNMVRIFLRHQPGDVLTTYSMPHTWDPDQYDLFREYRERPAHALLQRIPEHSFKAIADLGCGTGRITQQIAGRWPDAIVYGIDSSPEMLKSASLSSGDIRWRKSDIHDWRPERPLDMIFSNATLHWIDGHETLFPELVQCLNRQGLLAVQMPVNWDLPSHRLIRETLAHSKATGGPLGSEQLRAHMNIHHVLPAESYFDLLSRRCASLDIWTTDYLHVLRGEDAVYDWVKSTALLPVLDALNDEELEIFVKEYKQALREAYPPREDGITLYPFRRLFILAKRR